MQNTLDVNNTVVINLCSMTIYIQTLFQESHERLLCTAQGRLLTRVYQSQYHFPLSK